MKHLEKVLAILNKATKDSIKAADKAIDKAMGKREGANHTYTWED